MPRPKNLETIIDEALEGISLVEEALDELRTRLSAGIVINEFNETVLHLDIIKNKLPRLLHLQEAITSGSTFLTVNNDGSISEADPDTVRRATMGYFREGGNFIGKLNSINEQFRAFLKERGSEFWYQ